MMLRRRRRAGLLEIQPQIVNGRMAYEDLNIMGYEPPDWFIASWQQRIELTINAGQVPSTQNNFPLVINDTYPDLIGEVEAELRFTGADNIQLEYEIVEFDNSTGKLIAWAIKPTVSDGDPVRIYFDNPAAIDEQNSFVVWNNFVSVLHMEPSLIDSTGAHNGINNGTVDIAGKIGRARDFDGINDFVDLGNFDLTGNQLTLSAWIKNGSLDFSVVVGKANYAAHSNPFYKWVLFTLLTDKLHSRIDTSIVTSLNDIPLNVFTKIDAVYTGTEIRLFIDGVFQTSVAKTSNIQSGTRKVYIGGRDTDVQDEFFSGIIDEIRISNITSSDDDRKLAFNNESSQSTFYSTGAVEAIPSIISMGYEN